MRPVMRHGGRRYLAHLEAASAFAAPDVGRVGRASKGLTRAALTAGIAISLKTAELTRDFVTAAAMDLERAAERPIRTVAGVLPSYRTRHVAIGGLLWTHNAVTQTWSLTRAITDRCGKVVGPVLAMPLYIPPGSFIRRRIIVTINRLAAQGRLEELRALALTQEFSRSTTGQVTEPSAVRDLVENVTAQVISGISTLAVPMVVNRLAADPDQVRGLIREQSVDFRADLVESLRDRAAHGDDHVEQALGRLLWWRRKSEQDSRPV